MYQTVNNQRMKHDEKMNRSETVHKNACFNFSLGLESPSDASDQVAFVSAPAFLAKERFELPDDLGDSRRFKAWDLGRGCTVDG
jgi:hypothetical protein